MQRRGGRCPRGDTEVRGTVSWDVSVLPARSMDQAARGFQTATDFRGASGRPIGRDAYQRETRTSAASGERGRWIRRLRCRGLEVDRQLECGGLLDREVAGTRAPQDAIDKGRCPAHHREQVRPIARKPAGLYRVSKSKECRKTMHQGEYGDKAAVPECRERVGHREDRRGGRLPETSEPGRYRSRGS